jgi:hypothetical protein
MFFSVASFLPCLYPSISLCFPSLLFSLSVFLSLAFSHYLLFSFLMSLSTFLLSQSSFLVSLSPLFSLSASPSPSLLSLNLPFSFLFPFLLSQSRFFIFLILALHLPFSSLYTFFSSFLYLFFLYSLSCLSQSLDSSHKCNFIHDSPDSNFGTLFHSQSL